MRYLVGMLVLVLLLSVAAVGGEFSGLLTSDLRINLLGVPDVQVADFDADLDIDYEICGLTFGATTIVDESELEYILFDAWGTLGAIWFTSYLQFGGPEDGDPMDFELFATIAGLSLGGVDMFGAMAIDRRYDDEIPRYGWTLGAAGAVGECRLMVLLEVDMEVYYYSPDYYSGYRYWDGYVLASTIFPGSKEACMFYRYGDRFPFAFKTCDDWEVGWPVNSDDDGEPCAPCFEQISFAIDMPLGCLHPLIWIQYHHSEWSGDGQFYASIFLFDIELGIPFLEIDYLDIYYDPEDKDIYWSWGLVLGDAVCIEPWFDIDYGKQQQSSGGPIFDGIELAGLSLEYAFNGVTFKWGTLFSVWDSFDVHGNRYPYYYPERHCAPRSCEWMSGYDEYYALIIDGESCCGGGFGLSIFTWFDVDDDGDGWWGVDPAGIFGWEELRIEGYIDIGTNTTLTGSLSIRNEGLNWMQVGVEFAF